MTNSIQGMDEGEDKDHPTIMALASPAVPNRNRVKVYELRQNDWYDRGTGFCHSATIHDEAHLVVVSEDEPTRELLQTRISKDGGGYQRQQATLIVWTEENNTDMALSFQEAEGCANIWEFISDVQQTLNLTGQGKAPSRYLRNAGGAEGSYDAPDDSLSDEIIENNQPVALPSPELGNLQEVDNMVRLANNTQHGRDSLSKFIIEQDYIAKLVPLVEVAEDLESLPDLHRLCNIMKIIILLNDNAIIEHIVKDDIILGVVGALEYDPDFPSHKANHRQYLSDESRFKEVVKIEDPSVKTKIHCIYRLQYLKDVVLARILDDPTFSVLHSLIFYHQVDIVQHIQENTAFLEELFGIFSLKDGQAQRKKDAVLFIQQCTAIARGLQLSARSSLYQNFISHGLFSVISFALRHQDASIRVAGTDVLVALVDHDAAAIRAQIFMAINENTKPLTDTLIELLLIEIDLGVKAQIADVIKWLLDPNSNSNPNANAHAAGDNGNGNAAGRQNADYVAKVRNNATPAPQTEGFIQNFYDKSAKKLFEPFKDLEERISLNNLTIQEVSLYSHLVEILCFFVRQHTFRSKYFILSENLASRVAQLLSCPKKHLKLSAIKYFRTCIGLHDIFHNRLIVQNNLLEPILDIVIETMPRDNLLNSACLELFEFIRKPQDPIEILINSLLENCREKLENITYVDTFLLMVRHHDDLVAAEADGDRSFSTVDAVNTPNRNIIKGGQRWQGLKDADAEEEAYFNSSDNEEEEGEEREGEGQEYDGFSYAATSSVGGKYITNGASPVRPLVDYPVDEEDEGDDLSGSVKRLRRANDAFNSVDNDDDSDMDIVAQIPVPKNSPLNTRNASYNYNTSNRLHNNRTNPAPLSSQSPTPSSTYSSSKSNSPVPTPPERLSEKRRREEDDDEDELGKLSAAGSKRRSSSVSVSSLSSITSASTGVAGVAAPAPTIPMSSHSPNQSSSSTTTTTGKPTPSSSSSSSSSSPLSHANAAVQSVVHTLRRKKSMTGSGSSKSNNSNNKSDTTIAESENTHSGVGGGGLFGSFGSLKRSSQQKQQQQQQQQQHQQNHQNQKKSKAKIAISLGSAAAGSAGGLKSGGGSAAADGTGNENGVVGRVDNDAAAAAAAAATVSTGAYGADEKHPSHS